MAYTTYETAAFSGGLHTGRIAIEVDSQSISGNYSIINIKLQVREDTNASSYNNGGATVYLAVDGDTKVTDDSIDFRGFATGTWYTILSKTGIKVYHNTDGTKAIDVKGYCATGVGAGTYNQTASGVDLPTIPRKSSIASLTSSVIVDGSNQITVAIDSASSGFTHKVSFYIGAYDNPDYIVNYTGVSTSKSFVIPMSWLNAIPNAVSGTAKCRVETFSGSDSLGAVADTFTITVPTNVIPVVTGISFNRYASGDPFAYYAQGTSKVQVTGSTITNQYGATTAAYYWYITPSLSSLPTPYGDATFVSSVLGYSGTIYVALKVKDSRGRMSAIYSQSIVVYPYLSPSITLTSERCDSAGNTDANGAYIRIKLKSTVASVNSNNSAAYVLKYKKTTDSTWTTIDMSGYANNFLVDASFIRSASLSYSWEAQATVTDKIESISKTSQTSTAKVVMDFLSGGSGIAFGKVAETDGFEVAMEARFLNGIYVSGRLVKYYSTTSGDCDTITDEWHLGGNGSAHYPIVGSAIWWYVNTIFYVLPTSHKAKQIAYGFGTGTNRDRVFTRTSYNGAWTAWVEVTNIATSISFTYPSSLGTFAGNIIRYPALNRIFIDGTFTVATGKSISANTVTTLMNITNAADQCTNATALSIYTTQSYYLMGYIGAATGNIAIRSGAAIVAGSTIYLSGSWKPSA